MKLLCTHKDLYELQSCPALWRCSSFILFLLLCALLTIGVLWLFDVTLASCSVFQEDIPVLFHSKSPNREWLLIAAVHFQIYSRLVEKVTHYDSVKHSERSLFLWQRWRWVTLRQCIERIIDLPNLYSSAHVTLYIMGLSSGSRHTGQIISQGWYVLVLFLQWIGYKQAFHYHHSCMSFFFFSCFQADKRGGLGVGGGWKIQDCSSFSFYCGWY